MAACYEYRNCRVKSIKSSQVVGLRDRVAIIRTLTNLLLPSSLRNDGEGINQKIPRKDTVIVLGIESFIIRINLNNNNIMESKPRQHETIFTKLHRSTADQAAKLTLIIHTEDSSTDFLCDVYASIPESSRTVVRGGVSKSDLYDLIRSHDRVMMMGHGMGDGLLSLGLFEDAGLFIIDASAVELLREKTDSVFIWCYANEFVMRHGLHGFFTGMFISEVAEAVYHCGLAPPSQAEVDLSNRVFSEGLSEFIEQDTDSIHEGIMRVYGSLVPSSPVAAYNHVRLGKQ